MQKAVFVETKNYPTKIELRAQEIHIYGISPNDELQTVEKFGGLYNHCQCLLLPRELPGPTTDRIWLMKVSPVIALYDPEGRVHQLIFTARKLSYLILSDLWHRDPLLKSVKTTIISIDWASMTLLTPYQEQHRFMLPERAREELQRGNWVPQGEYEIEYDSLLRVYNIHQPEHSFVQENSFGLPPQLIKREATVMKVGYCWDDRFTGTQFVLGQLPPSPVNNNNYNTTTEEEMNIIGDTDEIQVMIL